MAEAIRVADYPVSLRDDLVHLTAGCWMFVGAMENHCDRIQELQDQPQFGRYCGPSLDAIRQLRNPTFLADRLRPLGAYPEVLGSFPDDDSQFFSARWLRKPLAGGGGRGITLETAGDRTQIHGESCYWQRMVEGEAFSAVFLSSAVELQPLMVSRQLIGLTEAAAPTPFAYCGSLGPWPVSSEMSAQLADIGRTLTDGLDYRGLLGIDFVWDGQHAWVVEVNPRYTASTELWELAIGRSAVAAHLQACGADPVIHVPQSPPSATTGRLLGKLILFADRPVISPDLACCLAPRDPWSLPWIADIPAAGSPIAASWPICTVFASGRTADECLRELQRRAGRVRSWFRDS